MIDSHCHLDHEPLLNNLSEVIKRSKEVGISKLLTICTTVESFDRIKKIIKIDPMIYGTFGIHPHETEESHLIDKNYIINQINQNERIIGIGETGLDFFYTHSNKERQIDSFKAHIEASIELNMPIIIHSRYAEDETYEILKSYKSEKLKILMHCFTGSLNFANQLLELNAFFSASGIITFKNAEKLRNTIKKLPIDRIIFETDSPYLTPDPHRGKTNYPKYLKLILEKYCEILSINTKEMATRSNDNYNKLFSKNK